MGKPAPRPSTLQNLQRFRAISWALWREYRALHRYRRGADPGAPSRFAARLTSLGPAFIKLGQVLSTRPDLLPDAYVKALSILQEAAPDAPGSIVTGIIETELGRPVSEVFASFDIAPAASASLAQVHRATLKTGETVAVKVRRPDVDALILRDLDAIGFALRLLGRLAPSRLRRTNLPAFLAEFRRYTLQELDFAHEGRVIERFRANFAGRSDVRFPGVHWNQSSSRVLTLDWVDGMRLGEAATTLDGPAKEALVTLVVDVLMKMFVSDGLFHADLHPGNIIFHEDGTFTLLDFGMYGELAPSHRDRLVLYWLAVVSSARVPSPRVRGVAISVGIRRRTGGAKLHRPTFLLRADWALLSKKHEAAPAVPSTPPMLYAHRPSRADLSQADLCRRTHCRMPPGFECS